MDMDPLFGSKGRDLEEEFFARQNQRLLEELRAKAARRERREALARATGIDAEIVLDKLIELDVNVERAAAFALVPLVELAWADGTIQPEERKAILESAAARGIEAGSVAFELLASWLEQKPQARLLEVWKEYTHVLAATFGAAEREAFKHGLLDRAREVASAAGGFLGMGKVSKQERVLLEELERAFE
jgi:hypothetical protein